MIRIVAPDLYDRRPGVLASIAEHVADLGDSAFVLGGETALGHALPQIAASLEARGLPFVVETFRGQPTAEVIAGLAARIAGLGSVVVIGVGGGKALDAAKAAGVAARRPIVTVPTVAATCAAWAALSVVYSAAGAQEEVRWLPYGPRRILVDPAIVGAAPARFLAAGVADTVVKWFETAPNLAGPDLVGRGDPLALRLQASFGGFTLETLEAALSATDGGTRLDLDPQAHGDLIDAVVGLAGLCGSVKGEHDWGGLAHPFYVAATRFPETRTTLHGAIVGLGLLVQWAIEGRPDDEIALWAGRFAGLGLPTTLADIGIVDDVEGKIRRLAEHVAGLAAKSVFADRAEASAIVAAIRRVDAIGHSLGRGRAA